MIMFSNRQSLSKEKASRQTEFDRKSSPMKKPSDRQAFRQMKPFDSVLMFTNRESILIDKIFRKNTVFQQVMPSDRKNLQIKTAFTPLDSAAKVELTSFFISVDDQDQKFFKTCYVNRPHHNKIFHNANICVFFQQILAY